jgi:hypothetical protein
LFALGSSLVASGASQAVLDTYDEVLLRRGDVNHDGMTNAGDVAALHAAFDSSNWLEDLNADGVVSILDVQSLISDIVRTVNGDFDLDRDVDGADFLAWQIGAGTTVAGFYSQGDADLNQAINQVDLAIWEGVYGTQGVAVQASAAASVPEPHTLVLLLASMAGFTAVRHRWSRCLLMGAVFTTSHPR